MRFAVIQLYDAGRRLTRDEIAAAAPVIGDLEVSDWKEGNAARRILRQAQLLERRYDFSVDLIPPLFDPVVLRITPGWMAMRGWQFHSVAPRDAREVIQQWLLRQVTPAMEVAAARKSTAPRTKQGDRE